jgi:hypothetical protein
MFLAPPATGIGSGLLTQGGRTTMDGAALQFDGADGAELSWCGARFQVGPGRRVRLEPLQGEPFAADASPAGGGNRDTQ